MLATSKRCLPKSAYIIGQLTMPALPRSLLRGSRYHDLIPSSIFNVKRVWQIVVQPLYCLFYRRHRKNIDDRFTLFNYIMPIYLLFYSHYKINKIIFQCLIVSFWSFPYFARNQAPFFCSKHLY